MLIKAYELYSVGCCYFASYAGADSQDFFNGGRGNLEITMFTISFNFSFADSRGGGKPPNAPYPLLNLPIILIVEYQMKYLRSLGILMLDVGKSKMSEKETLMNSLCCTEAWSH